MSTPQWFAEFERSEARRQDRLDQIRADIEARDEQRKTAASAEPTPPLTAEQLEHLRWLATSEQAIPVVDKPMLARLLDDRTELVEALLLMVRGTPEAAERAERVLVRMVW
jgi:hypothetical protein